MCTILALETSTSVCSVALSMNGVVVAKRESHVPNAHGQKLTLFIDEVMQEANCDYSQLSAVAVSAGPGSYTGLRIGVSVAKGLCFSLHIPLLAISTLQTMVADFLKTPRFELDSSDRLLPMLDARRMEVYTAHFDYSGTPITEVEAVIVDETSYQELLLKHRLIFFGNGAKKCVDVINHPKAVFVDGIEPLAENMIDLAMTKYVHSQFEDVAYFEPFYLKDFMITTSKKKVL